MVYRNAEQLNQHMSFWYLERKLIGFDTVHAGMRFMVELAIQQETPIGLE
jgi:hypothetical protein